MSGRYADRVGVPGLIRTDPANTWGYFDPKVPTLANYLHGAGYHTAIVGKWNLGLTAPGTPNDRGFDFFHGSAAERARPNGVWRGVWGQAVNAFPVFLQPLARAFHANSHPVAARRDGGPTAPVIASWHGVMGAMTVESYVESGSPVRWHFEAAGRPDLGM
eukprot:gene36296-59372_t